MNTFESHIYGSKPVLVDFFAEWCGPCKMMTPVLHEVKQRVGERVTILKMDIDKNPGFASRYNIQAVPTLLLMKEGNVVWRKSGVIPAHEIIQHLDAVIS
jgi:thioredoxin 1